MSSMSRDSVIGQVAIERAKCVIAVARDVQDDEAQQVLQDAATEAQVPESVAAVRIMAALGAGIDSDESAADMLERGLTAVRPVQATEPADEPPDVVRPQPA
ncbi:hypothetical protein ACH47X_03985 [Promicromonospora kroppenstedtii]|uniref:ANTAR domain-containing protein n=1 Tax=Promicromonospora kroppenstedtii TaxID=440482 RepID=A0ABW7XEW8_9MICO